jgi:hypothetical protein
MPTRCRRVFKLALRSTTRLARGPGPGAHASAGACCGAAALTRAATACWGEGVSNRHKASYEWKVEGQKQQSMNQLSAAAARNSGWPSSAFCSLLLAAMSQFLCSTRSSAITLRQNSAYQSTPTATQKKDNG